MTTPLERAQASFEYKSDQVSVQRNADRIKEAQAFVTAMQKQVHALTAANQEVCPHTGKRDVYDPGYAGGGHDGYKCEDCGKRGYF